MKLTYKVEMKFAWLPMVSFMNERFWLKSYLEVTLNNGVVLVDDYDELGEDAQSVWMVLKYKEAIDKTTEDFNYD